MGLKTKAPRCAFSYCTPSSNLYTQLASIMLFPPSPPIPTLPALNLHLGNINATVLSPSPSHLFIVPFLKLAFLLRI